MFTPHHYADYADYALSMPSRWSKHLRLQKHQNISEPPIEKINKQTIRIRTFKDCPEIRENDMESVSASVSAKETELGNWVFQAAYGQTSWIVLGLGFSFSDI